MKKFPIFQAVFVIIFFSILSFSISCNNNSSDSKTNNAGVDSVGKMIERGKYLANHVSLCIDCHSQRDYKQFSGPVISGTEGMGGEIFNERMEIPGILYARNITPDMINGIGKWSDEEITRAVTRGIRKNGDTLFPLMPYPHFNGLCREDINSIVTYIKTLNPNNNKIPERKLFFPVSAAYPPLKSTNPDVNNKPDVSDMVSYGGYVMNAAACMDCHTAQDKGQFIMSKYMAGGRTFNMETFTVTTSNITPDSATGIGKWTEEMFLDKFKNYRNSESYKMNPGKNNSIMPWTMYANMDDFDIRAIYRHLRTIPAVNNLVIKYPK